MRIASVVRANDIPVAVAIDVTEHDVVGTVVREDLLLSLFPFAAIEMDRHFVRGFALMHFGDGDVHIAITVEVANRRAPSLVQARAC